MRHACTVGGQEFTSKTQLYGYLKSLLAHSPRDSFIKGVDKDILIDAFTMHPFFHEKCPRGVSSIKGVVTHKHGDGGSSFRFIFDNNEHTDVSYKKMLASKASILRERVLSAMRQEIEPQIYAYRLACKKRFFENHRIECELSHVECEFSDLHVDHVTPFSTLAYAWMKENGIDCSCIPVVFSGEGKLCMEWRMDDEDQAISFYGYHRDNAVLAMVHWRLNNALGSEKKDSLRAKSIINDFVRTMSNTDNIK